MVPTYLFFNRNNFAFLRCPFNIQIKLLFSKEPDACLEAYHKCTISDSDVSRN